MAKGGARGKSSASSATRKKQATKAAKKAAYERDDDGNFLHPELAEALEKQKQPGLQRGQKKDKTKSKDGKGGKKGKTEKKKQFIPPPKPPQPLPDPLDSMGLASLLPADLVVLLRKASKKDVITRCRALEGMLAWIEDALGTSSRTHPSPSGEGEEGASNLSQQEKNEALVMMLPCWVHLFPRLALSPTRRLRLITMQIQTLLLNIREGASASGTSTRSELLESPQYVEAMLGPWAILCQDTDRTIERLGRALWKDACSWRPLGDDGETDSSRPPQLNLSEHRDILLGHLRTILLSPSPSFALSMTAAHVGGGEPSMSRSASGHGTPVQTPSLERDAKNRDDANVEEDTSALDKRLVAGALSVLTSIIADQPEPHENLSEFISSRLVWSSLSPHDLVASSRSPKQPSKTTSFGFDSPHVRSRAWSLLRMIHSRLPSALEENLDMIGIVAMTAAWQERDIGVQRSMLDAILPLLKARPQLWLAGEQVRKDSKSEGSDEEEEDSSDEDDESESEEEEDDGEKDSVGKAGKGEEEQNGSMQDHRKASPAYIAFLRWLQSACGGGPLLGYPAVVVFISTIPQELLPHDDFEGTTNLLTQFFSALYSRALDNDPAACRAFHSSFTECVTFLTVRMYRSSSDECTKKDASELARTHLGTIWKELLLDTARVHAILSANDGADEEAIARPERIKIFGNGRIVSDLHSQIRRLSQAAPDSYLVEPLLSEIEEELSRFSRTVEKVSIPPIDQKYLSTLRACLDRAISVLACLLQPSIASNAQGEGSKLQDLVSRLIHRTLKLTSDAFGDVAANSSISKENKRSKEDLLSDFMAILLKALICSPDHVDSTELKQLDHLASVVIPQLTASRSISPSSSASFLAAYLPICPTSASRVSIWSETLSSVAELSDLTDRIDAMTELLSAADVLRGAETSADRLELPVPGAETGIEDLVMSMVVNLCDGADLTGRSRLRHVVAKIIAQPSPFVEEAVGMSMLAVVTSTIEQLRNILLEKPVANPDASNQRLRAGSILPDLLDCLECWLKEQPKESAAYNLLESSSHNVIAAVSDLALLASSGGSASEHAVKQRASGIWKMLTADSPEPKRKTILQESLNSLREHLLDIHVPIEVLVQAAQKICSQLGESSALALLPSSADLQDMLVRASRENTHPALLVCDALVSQQVDVEAHGKNNSLVDAQGLGIFARTCLAITLIFEQDRAAARSHINLLPHMIILSIMIEDDFLQDGASKHSLVTSAANHEHLSWLQRSVAVATALASSVSDRITDNWHNDMVSTLQRGQLVDSSKDGMGHILSSLWSIASRETESSYLARTFCRLLNAAFNFGGLTESGADRWLKLGDSVQDRLPHLAQAIFLASKNVAGSSNTFDRLRNASAARLAGLGASTSQEKILRALRALIALAPSLDSELSLIPQQRAIFLLKDLQKWYSNEEAAEDPDEEVNTRLAELFVHLLPVVQDVQGSHIDFMFDIVETNLEFSSLSEGRTIAQLHASLRLLETLRDYALRNTNLREYWKDRKSTSLQLVRDHFLSLAGEGAQPYATTSAPRRACAELIVDLIRDVPSSNFSLEETAAPLCKLMVQSPTHEVQVVSYRLLSIAIKEHVKELVVDSAVNKEAFNTEEGRNRMRLPQSLIDNISDSLSSQLNLMVDEEAARRTTFGYFLSWIALFDFFEQASLSVKSSYVADVEKRGLLGNSLLPTVFSLVGLADDNRRLFDPSKFVIEEVFLDQIDVSSSLTVLQVVATHVYLRALIHMPTTVRTWWVDIKDRQLSMQISSFTTRHCSPVIAARELSHLREPEALAKLQDEALTIKILSTNEVIATYVVDEHPMEIGVKIPSDFPLHGVEIRDIQRVGITEAKWRSWLLAVQQLITGQNGLIFDALSLFKRNAEVQFQGLEECAICYSIISPMDRSLPSKPCKTCKNKFHSACLYKWISTSGASTCPLCRSIL